jgi:ribosomal protein L10
MDSLSLKASEMFSLQTEAEFKVEQRKTIEIAKNGILKGYENSIIADLTRLTFEQINKLRNEIKK